MSETQKTYQFLGVAIVGALSAPMILSTLLGRGLLEPEEVFRIADGIEDLLVDLTDDDLPPALKNAALESLKLLRKGPWAPPVKPKADLA